MDKRAKLPFCQFDIDPDELVRVVLFCPSIEQATKELGTSIEQMQRWQRGIEPVPQAVFAFLRLWARREAPPSWGLFSGLYLDEENAMLRHHAFKHRIRFDDLAQIPEFWRLKALAEAQAETIERLMIERSFYRDQCHREAKFGLMLNRLFDQ